MKPGGTRLRRGFWRLFALPGVVWLVAFFVVPFYAIAAVAMGRLDPLFGTSAPVWNPIEWDTTILTDVLSDIAGGGIFQTVFFRTCLYVVVAVTLCLLIGYPVAYYIARHGGRLKVLLLLLVIAPFWINYLMRMLAWINVLQDDGYVNRILMFVGLLDAPRSWLDGQPSTVVLGLVYGYIPFLILPLYAALDRIDQRLIEAARDLGASSWRAFTKVTLPLSKQGILAGSVIITLPMFGDYYTPDLLSQSPRTSMFGNQIDFFIHSGTGEATGATLALVLSGFVSLLMIYYLVSVARSSREAAS
jgi:spermidine/putrescine transport system permease protein